MGVVEGGGRGGLTWPLVLRIFGMVSITFFFAPPLACFISFFSFFFLRVKERINFYNKTLIIKVINYRTHS